MFRKPGWFGTGWGRPKNPHSLERLKYLHNVLCKDTTVSESNPGTLVESLRCIAEILIWADQNDSSVFETSPAPRATRFPTPASEPARGSTPDSAPGSKDYGVEEYLDELDDEENEKGERDHRMVQDAVIPPTSPACRVARSPIPAPDPARGSTPDSAPGSGDYGVEDYLDELDDEETPGPARGPAPGPRFRVEVLDPGAAHRPRGIASMRGRGGRGGHGGGGWVHGDALQEMYVNDTDLPLNIQEQIHDHLARRVRNERRRIPVNVEEENENEWEFSEEEFVWRGMDEWNGKKCDFVPELTEPTVPITDPLRPCMPSGQMTSWPISLTNRTGTGTESVLAPQRPRFRRDWYATNLHEIWTLIVASHFNKG